MPKFDTSIQWRQGCDLSDWKARRLELLIADGANVPDRQAESGAAQMRVVDAVVRARVRGPGQAAPDPGRGA